MKSVFILIIVTFTAPHEAHMNIWPMPTEQVCDKTREEYQAQQETRSDRPDHWITYCLKIDEGDLR